MLLTPHTLVGIAVAVSVKEPLIAVPTSFFLHFLGDLVPHWDFCIESEEGKTDPYYPLKVIADLSIGVGIGMFFTLLTLWVIKDPLLSINVFLCGIASVLPDAITGPAIFNKEKKGIPYIMMKIQHIVHFPARPPWGVISQIVVSLSCLILILHSLELL